MTEPTTEYRATDAEVYLDYEGRAQLVLFTGKGRLTVRMTREVLENLHCRAKRELDRVPHSLERLERMARHQ